MLGFPNDEVRYAFLERLIKVYTSTLRDSSGTFMIGKFLDSMESGDERVLTITQALMANIPYDSLPEEKILFLREHNYQARICLIFYFIGQYMRTEVYSSKGCSDVEVEISNAIYIFEFKTRVRPIDAINQIKEVGYAKKYKATSKNIFLIGVINIDQNERTLGEWLIGTIG